MNEKFSINFLHKLRIYQEYERITKLHELS